MATTTLKPAAESAVVLETELGWIALDIGPRGVRSLSFDHADAASARSAMAKIAKRLKKSSADDFPSDDQWVDRVSDLLTRFAAGEPVDFDDVPLDMEGL